MFAVDRKIMEFIQSCEIEERDYIEFGLLNFESQRQQLSDGHFPEVIPEGLMQFLEGLDGRKRGPRPQPAGPITTKKFKKEEGTEQEENPDQGEAPIETRLKQGEDYGKVFGRYAYTLPDFLKRVCLRHNIIGK